MRNYNVPAASKQNQVNSVYSAGYTLTIFIIIFGVYAYTKINEIFRI